MACRDRPLAPRPERNIVFSCAESQAGRSPAITAAAVVVSAIAAGFAYLALGGSDDAPGWWDALLWVAVIGLAIVVLSIVVRWATHEPG